MSTSFTINNDIVTRRYSADIDVGNKHRDHIRAQIGASPKGGDKNSPWNEAFSFTPDEYEWRKKIKPQLFDAQLDTTTRLNNWKAFAASSEGRLFRVR